MPAGLVQAAVAYYGEHQDELDSEIGLNEAEYERGRRSRRARAPSVRTLLDKQLSPQIASVLQQRGHDVNAVADRADLVARTDRIILEVATSEVRAVVNNNIKDFRPLATEWLAQGQTHAGLILLPSSRTRICMAVVALADALNRLLSDHPDGLSGSERWIGPLPNG